MMNLMLGGGERKGVERGEGLGGYTAMGKHPDLARVQTDFMETFLHARDTHAQIYMHIHKVHY